VSWGFRTNEEVVAVQKKLLVLSVIATAMAVPAQAQEAAQAEAAADEQLDTFIRAMSVCLEGRGYTVQ